MSRTYPRFLFSNPQDTKSKGPFLISTIPPLIICKVALRESAEAEAEKGFSELVGNHSIILLKLLAHKQDGNGFSIEVRDTMRDMGVWLESQIEKGNIEELYS